MVQYTIHRTNRRKIKEEKDKELSVDDIKKQIDEHISAELGDDAVGGG